jgi:outer membrane protein assembly factor BamB
LPGDSNPGKFARAEIPTAFEHVAMSRFVYAVLASTLSLCPAFADNWPQWRGPKNDGHSTEKGLVAEWGPEKNIVWKLDLPGSGSCTPCIWGDSIFLTTMDGDDVALLAVGTNGKEKWRKLLGKGSVRTRGDEGGNLASASCSTDGKLVFAMAGSGKLAAFDFEGKEIWSMDLAAKYGDFTKGNVIQFGGHWTPVLHKDRLYVAVMHRQAQKLIALTAETGKEIWTVDRKSDSRPGVESPDVYCSPFVWEKGDKSLIIVHGNDYCTAHDPADGHEVWRVTELNPKANYNRFWRAVSSPLVTPDLIVVPTCKEHKTVGINPEIASGTISPGATGEFWRLPKTPDVPSPLLVDGHLYLMGATGTLMVHDAKTGKLYYEERISSMRHRANPVYADGKIYLVGRDKKTFVIKPGTTFEKLADNTLPDTFTASPAIADGRIYLRGWKALYAIGTK